MIRVGNETAGLEEVFSRLLKIIVFMNFRDEGQVAKRGSGGSGWKVYQNEFSILSDWFYQNCDPTTI